MIEKEEYKMIFFYLLPLCIECSVISAIIGAVLFFVIIKNDIKKGTMDERKIFHLRQMYNLLLLNIIVGLISLLIPLALYNYIVFPYIFILFVYSAIGIKNVLKGDEKELPIIGKICIKMFR